MPRYWSKAVLQRLLLHSTLFATVALAFGCGSSSSTPLPNSYRRVNLVADVSSYSDGAGPAAVTDPNLKNPWGVAYAPGRYFWVSDNANGLITLYNGSGAAQPLVVTTPSPNSSTGGAITGQVYNGTSSFGGNFFLLCTLNGTIVTWKSGKTSSIAVDNSAAGAVYTGLAIISNATGNYLAVPNFSAGHIDVFDTNFKPASLPGAFKDPAIPAAYSPFNIQTISQNVIVTYAVLNPQTHSPVAGAGNGIVDLFDMNGNLLSRLATGSGAGAGGSATWLNVPWGVAYAPSSFGRFSNALLIGNQGDGHITALDPNSANLLGQLTDASGSPIVISNLWAIIFGNGALGGSTNTLYFTAGPNDNKDGLFGSVQFSP
jgi:uncharacterized protein (TIGR03118 family)